MKGVWLMKKQWEKYLSFIESHKDVILKCDRRAVEYNEDGSITIN